MTSTLITTGITCIIAAIVGGGLKAFGIDLPVLQSILRQVLLGAFGIGLLLTGAFLPVKVPAPLSLQFNGTVPKVWGALSGGIGGRDPFEISCKDNEVLVGLAGRTNQQNEFRIFNVGPVCSQAKFSGTDGSIITLQGQPVEGDHVGSGDGQPFSLTCPSDEVVVGVVLQAVSSTTGTYLGNNMTIKCSKNVPGPTRTTVATESISGQNVSFATNEPFNCPDSYVASAIKVRYGAWIDALTIGCRLARHIA